MGRMVAQTGDRACLLQWVYDAGITGGCTPTKVCPKGDVTRAEMASFLVRMFNLPPSGLDFFTDHATGIHENDINALAASGVTGGCATGRYCPDNGVTREQMASFIARAADLATSDSNPLYDDFRPHEGDINRLAAAGIGTGCAAYRFCSPSVGGGA